MKIQTLFSAFRWEDAQLAFELDALWHLTKDRHPLLLDKFKFRIASFVNGNLKNFPTMGLVHLLTKSKLARASRIFKPCIRCAHQQYFCRFTFPTIVDDIYLDILPYKIEKLKFRLVGVSVPFYPL